MYEEIYHQIWNVLVCKKSPKNSQKTLNIFNAFQQVHMKRRRRKNSLLKQRWQIIVRPQGCLLSKWYIIWFILHSSEILIRVSFFSLLTNLAHYLYKITSKGFNIEFSRSHSYKNIIWIVKYIFYSILSIPYGNSVISIPIDYHFGTFVYIFNIDLVPLKNRRKPLSFRIIVGKYKRGGGKE